jgi:uncharacterized protein YcbK (DUF882 family)
MNDADRILYSPHFNTDELRCKCGRCDFPGMDGLFMDKIEHMRTVMDRPFVVTSAYRCSTHNQSVSSTGPRGPHTTGRAMDIALFGQDAYDLTELSMRLGITGLGFKQHGSRGRRFIHLDDLTEAEGFPRPRVWSY